MEQGKIFKAAVINADQLLESQARGIGDSMMTETKEERDRGWFKRTLNRMWKHNLASEYYRHKAVNKARKDIIESGDLYKGEGAFIEGAQNSQQHKDAMNAIVERFISEYEAEMIHKGESKEKGGEAVNRDIKELIKSYVRANEGGKGGMSADAFKEEKNRILRGHNPEYAKEKSLYADNLLDIAKEVEDAVNHGQKLDEMDFEVDMTFGHAREGINTETKKTTLDKSFEWLGKHGGVPKAITQSTILTGAVILGYSIGKNLAVKLGTTGAKIAGAVGGVFASGVVAGVKENARLNRERAQHTRESAKGMKFEEPDMKRREQMEKNRYETKDATQIIKDLEIDLANARAGNLSEASAQEIIGRLADIEARIRIGELKNTDFIRYDEGSVEKNRKTIDLRRAELKKELRNGMTKNPMPFMNGQNFDAVLSQFTNAEATESLEKEMAQKNRIFCNMKMREIAKKMGKAMLIGATFTAAFSLVADEFGSYFNDKKDGVIEGAFKDNENLDQKASLLEAARRWMFQDGPRMPTDNMQDIPIDGTHMHMPEGVEMINNGDGTYNIVRDGEIISDSTPLMFDESGNLSPESRDLLAKDDIYTDFRLDGGTNTIHPNDWVDKNLDNLHRIERTHLGNNTEMYGRDENGEWILHKDPITGRMTSGADLNELRTHWTNGTGFDEKGFYSMNVQHMTDDGSFQDGLSAAAHEEMKNGKLMALLSVTKDSQRFVFEVPIDKDGLFHVDPTSPEGKMLFENVNGHAVYNGAFIEIAKQTGIGKDGHELMQILGTHEGTNTPHDIIEDTTEPHIIFNIPGDTELDPPIIPIPLDWRRPLERGKFNNRRPIEMNPYYYPYGTEGNRETWNDGISPRLLANPELKLNPTEEINWYFNDQQRRYPGYLERELAPLLNQEPAPMGKNVENVVCLAVAGHQEHANIYRTLDTYRVQQTRDGKSVWNGDDSKNEIFIYVNWPKGKDPSQTFAEIERFKKEHPEVIVRTYSEEIDTGKVEVGWYKKKVFDLALKKHAERNNGKDINIIANDADMTFSSPYYLEDISKKMNDPKNEKYDALLGRYDLDSNVYEQYPTFHASMRFWQFMESVMRSKHNFVGTQGRNTIMRGSSYAAVGGNRTREFWGDIEFGQLFEHARKRTSVAYENSAWLTVDPRREIDKFKSGELLAHTWSDFNSREVRGKSSYAIPEDLDVNKLASSPESDEIVEQFRNRLQGEMQEIVNLFSSITPGYIPSPEAAQQHLLDTKALAQRAIGFLGLKAVFTDREGGFDISITDTSKLRQSLLSYKEQNKKNVKIKNNPLVTGKAIDAVTKEAKKKPTRARKSPEVKVKKTEKISGDNLKTIIKDPFESIFKENLDKSSIEKFELDFVGSSIICHTEVKTFNNEGGTPTIDLDLVSSGEGLAYNGANSRIKKANGNSRASVNQVVAGIPQMIKNVLENKYGQKIKKIVIKDGELKMTFK